jgi:hypothetical protein
MVNIYVMAWGFALDGITPAVRINGIFSQELNMRFVKTYHLGGHQKHSRPIDKFMTKKTPSCGTLCREANNK